ncbi:MAG: tripartite tricarboxylate transporter substrate binding protein [Burkholderiaceae bacterium]|nr:tripartite tricarboxylate transporter substrate binding protein [Burkholderiaceae bacterium]
MKFRPSLSGVAAGAVMLVSALFMQGAAAQTYPSKPIRIVVPYAPGGFTDIVARLVARQMTERLGQPVIVENRAGASTIIGAEYVARAAPDGYTLLMAVTTTLSTNPHLFKKLPYKASDFEPIALAGMTPFVMSAHPSVPANTLKELIELDKAKPGTLNVATLGAGGSSQLVGAMFSAATGIRMTEVSYKGAGPALADVVAGHVQFFFDGIATSVPLYRAGQLKGIGITSETRSPAYPSLPTFVEQGLPNMKAYSWYGLLAPAGTPAPVITLLNSAMNEALQVPEVKARIAADGAQAPIMSPREFGKLIEEHTRVWGNIIKPLNIQLD